MLIPVPGMNILDLFFTLSFFVISFLILHPLSLICLRQKKWIQWYFHHQKQQAILYAALPQLLLQISSFLQSGYAFPQALENIAQSPPGDTLYQLLKKERETPQPSRLSFLITFLKSSIRLAQRNGMALSAIFKRISTLARDQIHFQEKLKVLTFPSKVQAIIAMLLPWFVLIIFALIDPRLISTALQSWTGRVGFSTAFFMELAALVWIRRILR